MKLTEEISERFAAGLAAAKDAGEKEPTAMTLSTVSELHGVDARTVLLKQWDEHGFVFYTNLGSAKAHQLLAIPLAALTFHWKSIAQQIRIQGEVEQVSEAEAEAYFTTRPRGSQIGAWASKQSEVLTERAQLERQVERFTTMFEGQPVPKPGFWGGFRLRPRRLEFWYGQEFRLHDRFAYVVEANKGWSRSRLYP